jgi:hypothetical protein
MSTLIDDLVATVKDRPATSFPELQRVLAEDGHNTEGRCEMFLPDRPDLVIWSGLSEELADVLGEAMETKRIHAHALASDLEVLVIYAGDGGMLKLPRAKRPPVDRPYTKPHWVPLVWYPGSGCNADSCLGIDAAARGKKRKAAR